MHLIKPTIKKLMDEGRILHSHADAIKGSSLDVRLHNILLVEKKPTDRKLYQVIPRHSQIHTTIKDLDIEPLWMQPGMFLLGRLVERLNLPDTITAKFMLDSSLGRCCLQHSAAISLKPGWEGYLTLELTNASQYHEILLKPNMNVGCIEFMQHESTEAYTGSYQNQTEVRPSSISSRYY